MANDKQQKKQQNNQEKGQSALARFSKIPMVEFSIFLVLSAYSKVKSSSELMNNLLNKVEQTTLYAFDGVKPYASKFERQISYADSLGNTALDKLESTVPSVTTFEPKNAYANTANRVLSWRRYLTEKLNVVRSFDVNQTVSSGLKTVENVIDEYIPGTEDDATEDRNNDVDDSVTGRVFSIVGKLRKRSLRRVQNIQRLVL